MRVRLLLLALGFIFSGVNARGSCREANLCCKGRDSSCVGINSGVALNSVQDAFLEAKPCYCDHACLKVGDCCPDFQEVCGVTDCEVSAWGPWTDCSVECGTGVMTRERKVTLLPTNGGKFCPELSQKRSCYGTNCDKKAHIKASQEPAMILPATYSTIRQLNATEDIRSNLRLRYRKDPAEVISKEYCTVFEITKARKSCESLDKEISQKFVRGNKVCVICETAAMRKHLGYQCQGHGNEQKTTRFTFLAFPLCHGRWQRIEVNEKCSCNSNEKPDFIFV